MNNSKGGRKMKFITEEDLRDLYKKEPFTNYEIEAGERLTPGARQFLIDKGIKMFETATSGNKGKVKNIMTNVASEISFKNKKLYSRMKSIESLFFMTEEELLGRDICLAQSLISIGKQFTLMTNVVKNKTSVENLYCNECTGINNNNFSDELDDCFEISDFHVQLEKGREIVILHRLRCELKLFVLELNEYSNNEIEQYEDMIKKLNQIVNNLSQLICTAFGGKKCQRQN